MIERIRTPLGRAGPREGEEEEVQMRWGAYKMHFQTVRSTHFLPHEDVVDHGAPAEHDAEADEDGRDDRRRRVEVDERVQDQTCESQ